MLSHTYEEMNVDTVQILLRLEVFKYNYLPGSGQWNWACFCKWQPVRFDQALSYWSRFPKD